MKRVILLIFYAMISAASLHADNEPDFYFEGLGYNIMSKTDLTHIAAAFGEKLKDS